MAQATTVACAHIRVPHQLRDLMPAEGRVPAHVHALNPSETFGQKQYLQDGTDNCTARKMGT